MLVAPAVETTAVIAGIKGKRNDSSHSSDSKGGWKKDAKVL